MLVPRASLSLKSRRLQPRPTGALRAVATYESIRSATRVLTGIIRITRRTVQQLSGMLLQGFQHRAVSRMGQTVQRPKPANRIDPVPADCRVTNFHGGGPLETTGWANG